MWRGALHCTVLRVRALWVSSGIGAAHKCETDCWALVGEQLGFEALASGQSVGDAN